MNQNKLQKARPALGWMERAFLFYRIALVLPVIAAVLIPQAFAVEDMWTAADRIIKDVYSKIAAISTVLAGLMSAVAVIGAKMSGTQQRLTARGSGSKESGSPGSSSTASARSSPTSARFLTGWRRWNDRYRSSFG